MIKYTKLAGIFFTFTATTFSLANTLNNQPNWRLTLDGLSRDLITPNYLEFASSAKNLHSATQTLCSTPNSNTLSNAKNAFIANVQDWQKVQWLNFGPATLFMRYHSFAYWPDKKGLTQRQLRRLIKDKTEIENEEFWQNASIAVRGLTAIEVILYRSGLDPITQPEYCNLLSSISKYHTQSVQDIHSEWVNGQLQDWVFLDEDESGDLATVAFEQLIQQWLEHVSMVKESKLEQTLGWHNKSNLKLAEFYRSGQTLAAIQQNLQIYYDIYHAGNPSLFNIAQQHSPEQAKTLEKLLINNINHASKLPTNLFTNEQTETERKQMAQELVNSLSQSQKQLTALVTGLGFKIGFNSRDGD